jgi:hypothetical protein
MVSIKRGETVGKGICVRSVSCSCSCSVLFGQVLVRKLLVFFPSPILCVYTNRRSKFKWKYRYRRERYIKRKCCRLGI